MQLRGGWIGVSAQASSRRLIISSPLLPANTHFPDADEAKPSSRTWRGLVFASVRVRRSGLTSHQRRQRISPEPHPQADFRRRAVPQQGCLQPSRNSISDRTPCCAGSRRRSCLVYRAWKGRRHDPCISTGASTFSSPGCSGPGRKVSLPRQALMCVLYRRKRIPIGPHSISCSPANAVSGAWRTISSCVPWWPEKGSRPSVRRCRIYRSTSSRCPNVEWRVSRMSPGAGSPCTGTAFISWKRSSNCMASIPGPCEPRWKAGARASPRRDL